MFKARRISITHPAKRCCAPGCGDKIKHNVKGEQMIEVTDTETGKVYYLEEGCIDWFENGHPDYGCARGKLVFEKKMTKEEWVQQLKTGDLVEDCKCRRIRIKEITGQGYEPYEVQVVLEDGMCCSAWHCLDPVDGTKFE